MLRQICFKFSKEKEKKSKLTSSSLHVVLKVLCGVHSLHCPGPIAVEFQFANKQTLFCETFFLCLIIIGRPKMCLYTIRGWRWMDAFWKPINSHPPLRRPRLTFGRKSMPEKKKDRQKRAGKGRKKAKNVISTDKNNTLSVTKRTEKKTEMLGSVRHANCRSSFHLCLRFFSFFWGSECSDPKLMINFTNLTLKL